MDEGLSEEIDLPYEGYSIERKALNLKEIKMDDPLEHEMMEGNKVDEIDEVDDFGEHETEDESTSDDSSDEPTETSSRELLLSQQ